MDKCHTAKHRKMTKKMRAKRREKRQALVSQQAEQAILSSATPAAEVKIVTKTEHEKLRQPVEKPISAARRAFQDM